MVIGADSSGCYVSEQEEEYVMTLDSAAFSTENHLGSSLRAPSSMDAPVLMLVLPLLEWTGCPAAVPPSPRLCAKHLSAVLTPQTPPSPATLENQ
ncbi:uncharacterized protein [Ambystoma mexicanum]|uniref:uncharacterized protein isoform X1 n=1 Tax=Ambystoma mexicanum TaxID=8296 RepID=UPI0037E704F1